ncbi:MAG: hypothetical protein KAI24_24165 [Planctomycetes bacterium]|nr:hypothetical protein [Planctomycetota bacterium]
MLDDLAPLRAMTADVLKKKLHCFPPRPAIQHGVAQTPSTRFPGQGEFRGETTRRGVLLQFVANAPELKHPDPKVEKTRATAKPAAAKDEAEQEGDEKGDKKKGDDDAPKDQVTVEVRDADGQLVRTFRSPAHLGLNRVYWRFERDGVQGPSRNVQEPPKVPPAGREVLPGTYRVTVRLQGEEQTVEAIVLPDPRVDIPMADRVAKDALRAEREQLMSRLHVASQRLAPIAARIAIVKQRLELEDAPKEGDDPLQALRDALKEVEKAHQATLDSIWGERKEVQGISRGNDGLLSKAQRLMGISRTDDAPTATERQGLTRAATYVEQIEQAVAKFLDEDLARFRAAVAASNIGLLPTGGE